MMFCSLSLSCISLQLLLLCGRSYALTTQLPNRQQPTQSSPGVAVGSSSASSIPSCSADIVIRNAMYAEMKSVADVLVQCFYQPPFIRLYKISEMNRLQAGFSDDTSSHQRLVALAPPERGSEEPRNNNIIGFCDIDLRPAKRHAKWKHNPRPYLSELCVHPDFRRQGIAQRLVEQCENFCREASHNEIFIRVEKANQAAIAMYRKLGYQKATFSEKDCEKTIILRKDL